MLYEIRYRYTGAVLFSGEYESLRACVEAAVSAKTSLRGVDLRGAYLRSADLRGADLSGTDLRGADLYGADLSGAYLYGADLSGAYLRSADLRGADLSGAYLRSADLRGANLSGTDLRGADLIDGGQDRRGFRFWAWRHEGGATVYRAGCHEWTDFAEALAWYGEGYTSTGDRHECLARLTLLRDEVVRRWGK